MIAVVCVAVVCVVVAVVCVVIAVGSVPLFLPRPWIRPCLLASSLGLIYYNSQYCYSEFGYMHVVYSHYIFLVGGFFIGMVLRGTKHFIGRRHRHRAPPSY